MKTDLEKLKNDLIARRDELLTLSKTGEQAAEVVELDQQKVGRISRMDAMQAQAVAAETERRRKIEISRIGAAIKRIESGDYGYCLNCDEEIADLRLENDPATPLCIECATKAEKK